MASLQEIYESLKTPETKKRFFELVSYNDTKCIIDKCKDVSGSMSLDDIPDLKGCILFVENNNAYISYTKKQKKLKWAEYGFANEGGLYYDKERDLFWWPS
jgi:hypothetical protein